MTPAAPDEFDWIASLVPLTHGDGRALGLLDDVAVLPSRPRHDLIISADAMTGGVHFLPDEDPGVIARRLLRTSLSDLAAKGAEPFGYLLMTAWPTDCDESYRSAFARGLAVDGEAFGIALLGGDTISTNGPLTLNAVVLGWAPKGKAVVRSGARAGDQLVVCGCIGDGCLGLRAARGEIADPTGRLALHYRLPDPLFRLRRPLRRYVRAAADVSDGLLADAGHVAKSSQLGLQLHLEKVPTSPEAIAWLSRQSDPAAGRTALATGGDDYALVCAVDPKDVVAFEAAVCRAGVSCAAVGHFTASAGLTLLFNDHPIRIDRRGWTH